MKKLSITWTKDESCCYILVINPWAIPDFNGFGFIAVQSSICWLNKSSVSLGSSQTHVHILDTGLGAWRPGFPVVPDTVSYQQYLGLRHGIFLTQDTSEELLEAFFFRFLGILDYLGWWTALLSNVRKAGMLRLNSKYLKIITWSHWLMRPYGVQILFKSVFILSNQIWMWIHALRTWRTVKCENIFKATYFSIRSFTMSMSSQLSFKNHMHKCPPCLMFNYFSRRIAKYWQKLGASTKMHWCYTCMIRDRKSVLT